MVAADVGGAARARYRSPMPLDTTTRMLAPFLNRLSDEELDSIPYGVIQLDPEGFVVSYNRAEAENAGYCPRPIGRHFFVRSPPAPTPRSFTGGSCVVSPKVDSMRPSTSRTTAT